MGSLPKFRTPTPITMERKAAVVVFLPVLMIVMMLLSMIPRITHGSREDAEGRKWGKNVSLGGSISYRTHPLKYVPEDIQPERKTWFTRWVALYIPLLVLCIVLPFAACSCQKGIGSIIGNDTFLKLDARWWLLAVGILGATLQFTVNYYAAYALSQPADTEPTFSATPPAAMEKLKEEIRQKVPPQPDSGPGEVSPKVSELEKAPVPPRLTTWEWFLELAFKNPIFYGYLLASGSMILAGLGLGSEK